MKVFSHPRSTYARRVRIYLIEKNLDIPLEFVDMGRLAHRKAEYLAINPYGRVPALDLGAEGILYESNSILLYLERRFPEPVLMSTGPMDAAKVDMELRLCDSELAAPVTPVYFARRFLDEEKGEAALDEFQKRHKKAVTRHLKLLAQKIGEGPWFLGEQFGLVDITYAPFLHFIHLLDLAVPAEVSDWAERLAGRKSIAETVPSK